MYRRSEGRFLWQQAYPTAGAAPGNKLLAYGVPLPGLYDTDAKTDLVVYNSTYFVLLFSGDTWTTPLLQHFPSDCAASDYWGASSLTRSSCVPVRGMTKHVFTHYAPPWGIAVYEPRLALSVWRPHGGLWSTNWSPTVLGEPTYCSLGSPGEIPIGGVGSPWTTRGSTLYSRYTALLAEGWSAQGTLGFKGAPCGTAWTRATPAISPKTMAFSVRDMTGDRLPEILLVNPATLLATVLASENDYTTSPAYSPIQLGMAGLTQWSLIL